MYTECKQSEKEFIAEIKPVKWLQFFQSLVRGDGELMRSLAADGFPDWAVGQWAGRRIIYWWIKESKNDSGVGRWQVFQEIRGDLGAGLEQRRGNAGKAGEAGDWSYLCKKTRQVHMPRIASTRTVGAFPLTLCRTCTGHVAYTVTWHGAKCVNRGGDWDIFSMIIDTKESLPH